MTSTESDRSRVLVLTDSTASMPATLEAQLGIKVINLHVILDGLSYEENVNITAEQCVTWVGEHNQLSTSQPSKDAFERAYKKAFKKGYTSVVVAVISSALSGTYANALSASKEVNGDVRVIESHTSGMALGMSVARGARLALAGATAQEVEDEITQALQSSRAYFMVDSLDHLRRGGRLSATAAAVGSVLGMKPILAMQEDGSIAVESKARSRSAALKFLAKRATSQKAINGGPANEIGVHHFGKEERATKLAKELEKATGVPVHISCASAVLGAHVGPGMIAVTFI